MTRRQELTSMFTGRRIFGLVLIIIGFVIYYMRPLQTCSWYNIFCHAGSALLAPIFLVFLVAMLGVGIYFLIRG